MNKRERNYIKNKVLEKVFQTPTTKEQVIARAKKAGLTILPTDEIKINNQEVKFSYEWETTKGLEHYLIHPEDLQIGPNEGITSILKDIR